MLLTSRDGYEPLGIGGGNIRVLKWFGGGWDSDDSSSPSASMGSESPRRHLWLVWRYSGGLRKEGRPTQSVDGTNPKQYQTKYKQRMAFLLLCFLGCWDGINSRTLSELPYVNHSRPYVNQLPIEPATTIPTPYFFNQWAKWASFSLEMGRIEIFHIQDYYES